MDDQSTSESAPIDGITPEQPEQFVGLPPKPVVPLEQSRRMRNMLIFLLGMPYMLYMGWLMFLMSFFPHPSGEYQQILQLGTLTAWVGVGGLILLWIIFFMRIMQAKGVNESTKKYSILRTTLIVLPGILLGAMTPMMIAREPALSIQITKPTDVKDFVAPVSVSFSVEEALAILQKRGLRAKSFAWDFDGDGEANDETVVPTVTAFYERPGSYRFTGRIYLRDGSFRRLTRTFTITDAVFKVDPIRPVVDEPVRFSIEHLLAEEQTVKEIQWDFDDDGEPDIVGDQPDAVHIFYKTGYETVRAVVTYDNQKQDILEKTIEIFDPEPPPFPLTIVSEPDKLISPAPFGTIFTIETDEPLKEVKWDFGDGEDAVGESVGHTFDRRGNYAVTVEARSTTGEIARLSKIVQVVETLRLNDLKFDGSHEVKNNTITDEVPVNLKLTPRTSLPLIQFFWEAPDATKLGSTENELQAIYRRTGTYTVTLLAHDPDGKAARIPLTLEVTPPSARISIQMSPEGGTAPLNARFDASETVIPGEEISGFEWSIALSDERGNRDNDVQQRGAQIEYLFDDPGTYSIQLKVRTTEGNVYEGAKTIVVRAPILEACFTASRTEGPAELGVKFNQSCTTGNATEMTWDFGDGSQTDKRDPIHVFKSPGAYPVKLTIRDDAGSVSSDTLTITVY